MMILGNDWNDYLKEEFEKPYYQDLHHFLKQEYATATVYPPMDQIFNALQYTSYQQTKVVIIGQDPYHGPGQAHGLSFSVKPGVRVPPSLKNIFKELKNDIGCEIPSHGSLVPWAKQGVLMLNTVLTVRAGEAASHKGKGWEQFTDKVIEVLNERKQPVIFLLWGRHAQAKVDLITGNHYLLKAPHPSPFSANRGFFGSGPFSRVNRILKENGEFPINWELPRANDQI
ncbi:uracil-DNA glycosylase [Bacillus solitudinis]|uniref:uracil-DNA glycosylase n=1 Tax=Bacillus solitudinis TaxID=2014074 RepID=UPI000C23FD75|nr:uracil-DNA glycosylase [Bacillus solitudinis]